MTRTEKRKLERYPLQHHPAGVLVLRTTDVWHPIYEVRDISDSGISFYMGSQLDVESQVTLEYSNPQAKVAVNGRVAWCSQGKTDMPDKPAMGGFVLGVELLNPMMLYTLLKS